METGSIDSSQKVYAAVNNIPSFYHSVDLRRFFSQFIETGGFDCFHFRHRPEKQSVKTVSDTSDGSSSHSSHGASGSHKGNSLPCPKTFCCVIRVTEVKFKELVRTYHERQWLNSKAESMSAKCLISRLKTSPSPDHKECTAEVASSSRDPSVKYQTRRDRRRIPPDRQEFLEEDLLKLPELRPPSVMPQGNVGTPTAHFMRLIQDCRLPPPIIKKLQLEFPKSRCKGKYGSVPFDYQTDVSETVGSDGKSDDEKGMPETVRSDRVSETGMSGSDNQSDNEICESMKDGLHDSIGSDHQAGVAVTVQPDSVPEHRTVKGVAETTSVETVSEVRTAGSGDRPCLDPSLLQPHMASKLPLDYKEKRRLKKQAKRERRKMMAERIEEKMIEFERAGSESEDDNDTCQEWERHEAMYDDVTNQGRNKDRLFEEEMEVVWEKGGSGLVFYTDAQYWQEKEGDFDEQTTDDLNVDMSAYYEQGAGDQDIRDFITIRQEQRRRRGIEKTDRFSAGIGKFERHTKGFGRKILEKQGWKEGSGLGSSVQGIADALDNDGQHPKDRKGFGYRGEKLVRYGSSDQKKRRTQGDVIISTVYDDPAETDPLEPLHRRNDPSYIKHRDRIN